MEAVRQIIDGQLLRGIIPLPSHLQNKKVEVIVIPMEEKPEELRITRGELEALVKGSMAESLCGIVTDTGMTLDDYRAERLSKYERTD